LAGKGLSDGGSVDVAFGMLRFVCPIPALFAL
jgi:hypothetical protein